MSDLLVFDTSVIVQDLREGRHIERIESVRGLIRMSSVVLSELWRGATRRDEREFLLWIEGRYPVLTPTTQNWLESGRLLGKIRAEKGFTGDKLRDLHFDVLIALTARSHGARVITANRADYELIRSHRKFDLEVW